jgi:hypothetical protein
MVGMVGVPVATRIDVGIFMLVDGVVNELFM